MSEGPIVSRHGLELSAYIVLALCWVLIIYLALYGESGHSVHDAAITGAFWLQTAILLARMFGPLANLADLIKAARAK